MALDIIFLIFAGLGFYMGFSKGIIQTVFTILSWTLGLVAAFKFAPPMTEFLKNLFNDDNPLMFVAGFILSLIVTRLILRAVARGLEGLLETAQINIINKLVGGSVLTAGMILVFSVLVQFAERSGTVTTEVKNDSLTYPYIQQYPPLVYAFAEQARPIFEDFWDYSVDAMDKVRDVGTGALERTDTAPTIRDIDEDEER
ncbi:MAG: CvpA family protein [Bacteroidota bacterium]